MQERFGRYEVVRKIARGGMAEVLLARLEGHGGFRRPVVIKRILPHYANDRAFVDMFLDEARIAASIRHPNVVHVEDLGLEQGEPFIVMEYLAGESVAALLERLRSRAEPADLRLAIHIVAETLAGLHAAHELTGPDGKKRGIVHRDVSPQNVMLTYDGHVKVLDFGIARAEGRLAKTSTGEIKGKIAYMSPEQCRGEQLDARSDLFAAGAMLYELATLRHPFRKADESATLLALVSGDFAPLASEERQPELEKILAQSLTTARAARYASAADMRRDLGRLERKVAGDDPLESVLAARMNELFADRVVESTRLAREIAAPRPELETVPESDFVEPLPAPEPTGADRRVGRYTIHELLGAGGMAEVYYGTLSAREGISRPVAIKKLYPQLVADEEAKKILLDEARVVARVHHPNVVSLLDVVSEEGDLFLVLEYVHGETLASVRRALPGPLEPAIAVGITIGALEGLHAAHVATDTAGRSLGIVHRDVSPQNIMVGADGMARVLDFGVAKAQGRAQQATRTGLVKGKLAYMAPEQLRTGLASVRSDVFSAALVLWELLAGRPLFDGVTDAAIRTQVLTMPLPKLGSWVAVSPELEAALEKALARDPADRFESAASFAAALEQAVAPATSRKIGSWLETAFGSVLAERAAAVRRFTTTGDNERDALPVHPEVESAAHQVLSLDTPHGATPVDASFERPSPIRRWLLLAAAVVGFGILGSIGASGLWRTQAAPSGSSSSTPALTQSAPPTAAGPVVSVAEIVSAPVVVVESSSASPAAATHVVAGKLRVPAARSAATAAPTCKLVPQTDARGIVTFERVCK